MLPLWPNRSADTIPFFKTYRLGPVLAYNLCREGTRTNGREKLFSVLSKEIPEKSKVLLCFGEIDCRVHLIKQSELQQRDLESVVVECVERYFQVVQEITAMSFEVAIWNVIPSSLCERITNPEYPAYGTCRQRNDVTRLFNDYLEKLCHRNGTHFISIFDDLLDGHGLTNMAYYMDDTHLSQKAMPFVIDILNKKWPDLNLKLPISVKARIFFSKFSREKIC